MLVLFLIGYQCDESEESKLGEPIFCVSLKLLDLIYFILAFVRLKSNTHWTLHLMFTFNK